MADSESPRFDLTTLGETMLRLSVPAGQRLEEAQQLAVQPGGSESNVCAALAALGRRCGWVSRLPDNPLGHLIVRRLRAAGIDTSAVVLTQEGRVGTYYAEFAVSPRSTQVVYDRADSAVSHMSVAEVNWDYLLDTRLLHLTGITPALSESCMVLVAETVRRARRVGVTVSFDVNYRRKLSSPSRAAEVLKPLLAEVDLLICGEEDARELFGLEGDSRQVLTRLQALTSARQLVLTQGEKGASAVDNGTYLHESAIPAEVLDRFGAGDAFAAGVLDGILDRSLAQGLRRGVILAALTISQRGDMLVTSRDEMMRLQHDKPRRILR